MPYRKQQITKVCGVCNRDFLGNSKQKYCTPECAAKKQKEQLAALAEYRRKCPHCGNQIGPKSGKHRARKDKVGSSPHSPDYEDGRKGQAAASYLKSRMGTA